MARPADRAARLLLGALDAPGDPARRPLVAFVQQLFGCGCPEEVIRTARLSALVRPLRDCLSAEAAAHGWEEAARRLNACLGLPPDLSWPGAVEPLPPWRWPAAAPDGLPEPDAAALSALRRQCEARAGLLIDVPGRALFVVAVTLSRPSPTAALEDLHRAATLVKELGGYNRVRLFTLSARPGKPKTPPGTSLDAALTWGRALDLLRSCGCDVEELSSLTGQP